MTEMRGYVTSVAPDAPSPPPPERVSTLQRLQKTEHEGNMVSGLSIEASRQLSAMSTGSVSDSDNDVERGGVSGSGTGASGATNAKNGDSSGDDGDGDGAAAQSHSWERILRKKARARTDDELDFLFRHLQTLDVKFFSSLSKSVLRELCVGLRYERFNAGEAIVKQGDIGRHFYVIAAGTVHVFMAGIKAVSCVVC
jgi:hypothetical protein